jgi:hypothetical protein
MKYIPANKHWTNMYKQYDFYTVVKKFPIDKIRIKPLRNKLDTKEVWYRLMNFDRDAWIPITLDTKHFLVDGQHRLELAKQFGMEFIDTIVLDEKKLKQGSI